MITHLEPDILECEVRWVFVAGLSLVAVHGFLLAVVSLVAEHGLRHAGFSS